MVLNAGEVVRSDILLPASHPRRLSRTIRTRVNTIFDGHFTLGWSVGMRIEQASTGHEIGRDPATRWNTA
jgi:hypothetical protein